MQKNKTVTTILKSYLIALFGCILLTGINAISDIKYSDNSVSYILKFHFLSSLGYAIPISLLVFYVIRNQDKNLRVQKVFNVILYLALIVIGAVLGSIVATSLFVSNNGGLDALGPMIAGQLIGAIVLPVIVFFVRRR